MKIAITGGNGLVGSALVRHFQDQGHTLVLLQRKPATGDGITFVRWELGQAPEASAFQGVDALIHCAYDFGARTPGEIRARNVDGSIRLFEAAKRGGVRQLVFVSSVSAFPGCRSLYGTGKLEVETWVNAQGGVSLRPGLVFGDPDLGMFGSLHKLTGLPVLPLFDRGSQTMTVIHRDDLARAVSTILGDFPRYAGHALPIARPEPLTFKQLLESLARLRGRKVLMIPFPSWPLLLALRLAERFGLRLPFRSDSLVGLLNSNPRYDFSLLPPLEKPYRNLFD